MRAAWIALLAPLVLGQGIPPAGPGDQITASHYNVTAIPTAGLGVEAVVSTSMLSGQTAAVASLISLTTPNDGNKHLYLLTGIIKITAYTSGSVVLQIAFTDEGGAAQTGNVNFNAVGTSGFTSGPNTVALYQGAPLTVMANPNTTITVKTAAGFVATYDVGAVLTMLQ